MARRIRTEHRPLSKLSSSKDWRPTPLALACAIAWSGATAAPGNLTVPVPVAPGTVVGGKTYQWQPNGQGSTLKNVTAGGKITQTIGQTARRAIYNWASFDIGRDATVNFEMTGGSGSSALNRVVNSLKPSEIFGRLNANGDVFLINRNGILFGRTAQVNVQGLVASTLDINDQVYLGGLSSIDTEHPTFAWKDESGLATFDHEDNYVKVEQGGNITTASGGRVFLLARQVENAGTISTPQGQTALVAGDKVWLKSPDKEVIYASEANPKIPALRGLLFEVSGEGEARNLGTILTERGNTTLVGYAVRNEGRIRATTSVTENGSVLLTARSGAEFDTSDLTNRRMMSRQGGKLTLGAGSRIEIGADNVVKGDGNSTFTRSRIELAGQTIDIGENSVIQAPGAVVNIRAEAQPDYKPLSESEQYKNLAGATEARVIMRKGAVIDVAGTTDTNVSVARNFVTTELLGKGDFKDAPLQKDGALYRSKVTFDVREGTEVLGDTSSYAKGIQKTANERLASGGAVTMASDGAVITHQNSTVNISGGQVTYTEATVNPTLLKGADGKTYTMNTARKDVMITAVASQQDADETRYGSEYKPTANLQGQREAGYVEGQSAGSFQVHAPRSVALNQIKATTVVGARQRVGKDALAAKAAVRMGFMNGNTDPALSPAFAITRDLQALDELGFWDQALTASITGPSRTSVAVLNAADAGKVEVSTNGALTVEDGADLRLADAARLTLKASGEGGIVLGGDITGQGASVNIATVKDGGNNADGITLKAGRQIDVSGGVVNRWRDGGGEALAGGAVTLSSAQGLDLQDGSRIDVSGGATITGANAVVGTRAGTITLEANTAAGTELGFASVHLGASLQAMSLANTTRAQNDAGDQNTGKLRLKVGDVRIVQAPGQPLVQAGAAPDSVVLSTDFFTQGGFDKFDIEGVRQLELTAGAVLAPVTRQWASKPGASRAVTGQRIGDLVNTVTQSEGVRPATTLSLASSGSVQNGPNPDLSTPNGRLVLAAGSQLLADAGSKISLSAGNDLQLDGQVRAAGGTVKAVLAGTNAQEATNVGGFRGRFRIGPQARIDVSGKTLIKPGNGRLIEGRVLDGGTISLDVGNGKRTSLDIQQGAELLANGAVGVLDVRQPLGTPGALTRREAMASNGGKLEITAGEGGALLAGGMQAKAGNSTASGGSFSLMASAALEAGAGSREDAPEAVIRLQQAAISADVPHEAGVTRVSADALQAGGFDTVKLTAQGAARNARIETDGDVTLRVNKDIVLNAPTLAARDAGHALFQAGSRIVLTNADSGYQAQAIGGQATWTLQSDLIAIGGNQATAGIGQLDLAAQSELRAFSVAAGKAGRLSTQADVHLSAPQVTVSTATDHTLDATGHHILIDGGDANVAKPLSAGGKLTLQAQTIDQNGVIRAPFGQIELQASERLTLGQGSETSVSGSGLSVPYGLTTDGGVNWKVDNQAINQLPEKTITLKSDGGEIKISAGSTTDVSGGGQALAWEFVPGPGGSKDIFTGTWDSADGAFAIVPTVKGHAPMDLDILTGNGVSDVTTFETGRQITFGPGGPLPAGTYTVLPARYALLEGGYLVKPTGGGALALGKSVAQTDGSTLIGGVMGYRGTGHQDAMASTFQVMPKAVAQRYSEIRESQADTFFGDQAAARDLAAPRGARDGGTLNLLATRLSLQGSTLFKPQGDGQGGELNIASNRILVGDGRDAGPDVLSLDVAQLNASGASSLMLGGLRQGQTATGARAGQVSASEVIVDTKGQVLSVGDVVLAARDRVELKEGSRIEARPDRNPAQNLAVTGDGALVRVSAQPDAQTTRSSTEFDPILRERGELVLGANTVLKGGAVVAEATRNTQIDASADLNAQRITLGAARVAVGAEASLAADENTLVLSSNLASRLAAAERATLRSFGGIDMVGQSTLGGASQKSITLDTSAIRLVASPSSGQAAQATVQAGSVTLSNTTGLVGDASQGNGSLTILATGQQGTSGHVVIGQGDLAVSGAQSTRLEAAGSVVVQSTRQARLGSDGVSVIGSDAVPSSLSVGGDLTVQAQTLTTGTGHNGQLLAGGTVRIERPAAPSAIAAAATGIGGRLTIEGERIEQAGTVDMASGALTLKARGLDGADSITFSEGSRTLLAGSSRLMDGVKVGSSGGDLIAKAATGHIAVADGALVDVSAPQGVGGARAGSVTLEAPQGQVKVQGTLKALAGSGQGGGSLKIDSREGLDLEALAARLAAHEAGGLKNFSQQLQVRQRDGDMTVSAGTTLKAHELQLVNDGGALTVHGHLDARAPTGGQIVLAARDNVTVAQAEGAPQGALLDAGATAAGAAGGDIDISTSEGRIALDAGATLSSQGGGSGQGGRVILRAGRTADNRDVKIDQINASIQGAGRVLVDGVKVYEQVGDINKTFIDKVNADNSAFMGAGGATVQAVKNRLAGGQQALADLMSVRPGVEARSTGDMKLTGIPAHAGWNLMHSGTGGALARVEPLTLTLRAAGNLVVQASLSDGIKALTGTAATIRPEGLIQEGEGASFRLVGGADTSSANVLATRDGAGNVTIGANGKDVIVRTTTGDIDIAAGSNIEWLNEQAVVYTTGRLATPDEYASIELPKGAQFLTGTFLKLGQTPFLTQGGRISLNAQADLVATPGDLQDGTHWWWRNGSTDPSSTRNLMWFSRYDKFKQGVATFGGGDVRAVAGGNAINVGLSAATSGYVAKGSEASQVFGGGRVTLTTGGDVVGGFLHAGGATLDVSAGGDVKEDTRWKGLQLHYQDTRAQIEARQGVTMGRITDVGTTDPIAQAGGDYGFLMSGMASNAALHMTSASGDLNLTSIRAASQGGLPTAYQNIFPANTSLLAPEGSIQINALQQLPAAGADLQILAHEDLSISFLTVAAHGFSDGRPREVSETDVRDYLADIFDLSRGGEPSLASPLYRDPVHLLAETGSLTLGTPSTEGLAGVLQGGVSTAKPVRIVAGTDMHIGSLRVQQQSADEISVIRAGRDINFPWSGKASAIPGSTGEADLLVQGPGDVIAVAGRHLNLDTKTGVNTTGSRNNVLLPDGSAHITLLAGVDPTGQDYTQAQAAYFHLLGAAGVAGWAADLAAQLEAAQSGKALPALGSSSAASFAALSPAEQLQRAKNLAGDAAYEQALLNHVRHRESRPELSLAQAKEALGALPPAEQSALAGRVLETAWRATLPAEQRQAQAMAMAAAAGNVHASSLTEFVKQRGKPAATLQEALSAFDTLSVEERLLFTNQVLNAEVLASGRAAAQLAGDAKQAAYQRGYQAIESVFPGSKVKSDILMGASLVKTLQSSNIVMMAPHGGINVGSLAPADPTIAASLGIVTTAGGNVNLLVRDNIDVNQSRIFSVGKGDMLLWASNGNIDAGRGAKTVVGSPPPLYRTVNGKIEVDTSGSFSGSGIAGLDSDSRLDLYAPRGEINAGDAGIKSGGMITLDAVRVIGADNIAAPKATGLPPPVAVGNAATNLGSLGQAATAAGTKTDDGPQGNQKPKRRRVLLDFLGFGNNDPQAQGPDCRDGVTGRSDCVELNRPR